MKVDVPRLLEALGVQEVDQRGDELWAPCPMPDHDEREASWSIHNDPTSDKHGLHKCFGCHRSGGPVHLTSKVIGITEVGAYQWIKEQGLWLDVLTPDTIPFSVRCSVRQDPEPLTLPPGVVVGKPFREWPQVVRRYVAARGITRWQVETYGVGYSVGGSQEARIVVPVRDQLGRLLFYTGRSFALANARYRSCNQHPSAHPDRALFGEALWHCRPLEEVYLVEGAIKGLAVERATCPHGTGREGAAIAGFCGSELHEHQLAKLRRFGRITIVSDPDPTGQAFAERLLSMLCAAIPTRVVVPPEGYDADALTRQELRALLGYGTNSDD